MRGNAGEERIPRQKLIRNCLRIARGTFVKDKFFFFINYEGRRDRAEETDVREVPTASLRQGIIRYYNERWCLEPHAGAARRARPAR